MNIVGRLVLGTGIAAWMAWSQAACADSTNAPDFTEVYGIIQSNVAGVSTEELNRAAVEGLLGQLHAKVSLVAGAGGSNQPASEAVQLQSFIYDGPTACIRVATVAAGAADKLAAAVKDLSSTNKLKGLILDLRYSGGGDYAAAAAAADLFLTKEMPLLDWGTGSAKSSEKTNAISLPLVVLVNKETTQAGEALAAVLRENAQAIVLGAPTAGDASVGRDFPLHNGQTLRISTTAVKLGDGQPLPSTGVKPDIQVNVKAADEKAYFADPYKDMTPPPAAGRNGGPGATTNRTRLSEADLIRERRERPGMELNYDTFDPNTNSAPAKPVVHDPVLGRALDLMKGIAAFRQPKS